MRFPDPVLAHASLSEQPPGRLVEHAVRIRNHIVSAAGTLGRLSVLMAMLRFIGDLP